MRKLLLPFFLPIGFLLSQEILSIEPDVGVQGQDVWVMIYAEDTHFLVADTVNAPSNVNGVMITSIVDGSIINAISYTPITATSLEAMLVIPANATPGEYNVTIEQGGNHGAVTVEDFFYIEEEPAIVSVNPSSAEIGMEIWVTITGSETYFVVTDTVGAPSNVESVMFKIDENIIEAISFTPVSRTVLEAMFVIPDDAETGLYDVIVEPILGPANFYYAHEAFTVFGPSAPSDFSLLSPDNNSTISVEQSDILTGSVDATWESSSDDDRTITYLINHTTNIGTLPFIPTEVETNSMTIIFADVVDEINTYLLQNPLSDVNSLMVNWDITAVGSDGTSTNSTNGPFSFTIDASGIYLDLDTDTSLPKYFSLNQNYPNPFNPTTTISFSIAKSAISSLDIYDIGGNLVRELKNGYMQLGNYSATWDGRSTSGEIVPSGFYIYQLKSESNISTKKMLMIK